jgi:hypothetical protein
MLIDTLARFHVHHFRSFSASMTMIPKVIVIVVVMGRLILLIVPMVRPIVMFVEQLIVMVTRFVISMMAMPSKAFGGLETHAHHDNRPYDDP